MIKEKADKTTEALLKMGQASAKPVTKSTTELKETIVSFSPEQNRKDLAYYKQLKNLSREATAARREDEISLMDTIKTLEETKLEMIKERYTKEVEATKSKYDNEIAIASSTAVELIKAELNIRAEEELTREEYIEGRKRVEAAAAKGDEEQRKRFLDIVASENAAADVRRDKKIALAELDRKYAEEQFVTGKQIGRAHV